MEKSIHHKRIKAAGYTIGFLEKKMTTLPKNTFYNFVNGAKPLPEIHKTTVKKVLKKYGINLVV